MWPYWNGPITIRREPWILNCRQSGSIPCSQADVHGTTYVLEQLTVEPMIEQLTVEPMIKFLRCIWPVFSWAHVARIQLRSGKPLGDRLAPKPCCIKSIWWWHRAILWIHLTDVMKV
jgi:hypothetical protein